MARISSSTTDKQLQLFDTYNTVQLLVNKTINAVQSDL